jgi:hypothetical protein
MFGEVPARPFIGLSEDAVGEIIEITDQWFQGVTNLYWTKGDRVGRRHAKRMSFGPLGSLFVKA